MIIPKALPSFVYIALAAILAGLNIPLWALVIIPAFFR